MSSEYELAAYAECCGPIALAAIHGCTPTAAAAALQAAAEAMGEPTPTSSTRRALLLRVLEALGYEVEVLIRPDLERDPWQVGELVPSLRGTFLLLIAAEEHVPHVMVAADGKIIAGDDAGRYGAYPIAWAYRVERRPCPHCGSRAGHQAVDTIRICRSCYRCIDLPPSRRGPVAWARAGATTETWLSGSRGGASAAAGACPVLPRPGGHVPFDGEARR